MISKKDLIQYWIIKIDELELEIAAETTEKRRERLTKRMRKCYDTLRQLKGLSNGDNNSDRCYIGIL
jgi:hypothetical protein